MGTPVPGPGKFSERTDKAVSEANRDLPNAGYGEQAAYQAQQAGAPMAKQDVNVKGMNFADLFGNPADNVVGLDHPTQHPNTPVTDGADAGPGADSSILGLGDQSQEDLQSLLPYMPVLEFMANQPGASWAMRNIVRKAKSM